MLWNMTVYFQTSNQPAFLVEKLPVSRDTVWRTAFQFHVVSAAVCILTGFPLMFPGLLRFPRLHFVLGYIHLNAVLWIAAPSGLILAPHAKGGFPAATGFAVTGLAWWWSTWLGYRAIRRGALQQHIRWMVRSFSIALSAVFFRVIHIALGWLMVPPVPNYTASIWLSLAASVLLSESCIFARRPAAYRPDPGLVLSKGVSHS